MTEKRISADELARRISVPASTIKKIRNNYNPNPTLTTLLPIADFFSITLGQLVGNEPLSNTHIQNFDNQLNTFHQIPILSWEEAISWPKNKNHSYKTIENYGDHSEDIFALVVNEDGWENIAKHTLLLVDPAIKPEHRDLVIVYKTDQASPSLKQIVNDDGIFYLKSVTTGHSSILLTNEYRILGVVTEYKKYLKKNILE